MPARDYRLALQLIHLDPLARNPDLDIEAPGHYTIQLGLRDSGTGITTRADTAFVYHPDGRCLGFIPEARARELETEYHTYGGHQPAPRPFPEEVARLLHRYRQHGSGDMQLHPAFRDAMLTLGITQERYASPLDFHPHLRQYSSLHPEDELFGATGHAYQQAWVGGSIAHPPSHHCRGAQSLPLGAG
jgi:hypothetical protein